MDVDSGLLRAKLAEKVVLQDWMTSSRYAWSSTNVCFCRDLDASVGTCGPLWALVGPCTGCTGLFADAGKLRSEIEAPVRRPSKAFARTRPGEPSNSSSATSRSRLDGCMVAKGRPEVRRTCSS